MRAEPDSETDLAQVRSGLYGSFLSGGFGGVIYGAEGIWQADTEDEALYPMWKSFLWRSGDQVRHLKTFAEARGSRYRELVPDANLVVPSQTGQTIGYTGWRFAAATPERDLVLIYFEPEGEEHAYLRSLTDGTAFRGQWFDPRSGKWGDGFEAGAAGRDGKLVLPSRPDHRDWGLMLEAVAL